MNRRLLLLWLASLLLFLGVNALHTALDMFELGMRGRLRPGFAQDRFIAASPVWVAWWLITPAIVMLSRRLPIIGGGWRIALPVHAVGVFLATALHVVIVTFAQTMFGLIPTDADIMRLMRIRTFNYLEMSLVIYLAIAGITYAVIYSQAYVARRLQFQRLEALLARERVQALQLQLQPHFLFNTLNTISSLMESDVRAARRTMTHLSDLLRAALAQPGVMETTLGDELAMLEKYLAIQRQRFGPSLHFEVDAAGVDPTLRAPRLLLQPLVENAVRHGTAPRGGPGHVRIMLRESEGVLAIDVEDDGVGLPAAGVIEGIGIRNTRERLEYLHPGASTFELMPNAAGGATARIRMPATTAARLEAHA